MIETEFFLDNLELKVKSLEGLDKPITKVYWNQWGDFELDFKIQISKKNGRWRVEERFGPHSTSYYWVDSWTIFQANTIEDDSSRLFTEIRYDGKEGKLVFEQNTHNGTKSIEIEEFELNKKIDVHVTDSKVLFDGKKMTYVRPETAHWYTAPNELQSKRTQVTIYAHNGEVFKVTDFKVKV